MRATLLAILLATSIVSLSPVAFAHHCAEAAPDQSGGTGITIPQNPAGVSGTIYPFVSLEAGVSLWMESGQEPGLQANNGACRTSNGNQGHYGRDCRMAAVGPDASVFVQDGLCGLVDVPALP